MGRKVFATNLNKSRLIIAFGIFSIFMLILCIRLGYIQFVKSDEYEKMAGIQQIRDEMILPKRGNILDCNNQELAVSSVTYSSVPPKIHIESRRAAAKTATSITLPRALPPPLYSARLGQLPFAIMSFLV